MLEEIYSRQLDLIDPTLLTKKISIIGAGSIGSWTALSLLKMGCQNVKVYDFDTVEEANIGSQIYTTGDVGLSKIEALRSKLELLTLNRIEIQAGRLNPDRLPETLKEADIIISAVDNIETRTGLFNFLKDWAGVFIDARMAGNALEVYTIPMTDIAKTAFYEKTLFAPTEALPIACSARSVVYNVFIVGGIVGDVVAKLAKRESVPQELVMDLANFTLYGGL